MYIEKSLGQGIKGGTATKPKLPHGIVYQCIRHNIGRSEICILFIDSNSIASVRGMSMTRLDGRSGLSSSMSTTASNLCVRGFTSVATMNVPEPISTYLMSGNY